MPAVPVPYTAEQEWSWALSGVSYPEILAVPVSTVSTTVHLPEDVPTSKHPNQSLLDDQRFQALLNQLRPYECNP